MIPRSGPVWVARLGRSGGANARLGGFPGISSRTWVLKPLGRAALAKCDSILYTSVVCFIAFSLDYYRILLAADGGGDDNVATRISIQLKLFCGLFLLLTAGAVFGAKPDGTKASVKPAATLPACSTMGGTNQLCGQISGVLGLVSGPDPLGSLAAHFRQPRATRTPALTGGHPAGPPPPGYPTTLGALPATRSHHADNKSQPAYALLFHPGAPP